MGYLCREGKAIYENQLSNRLHQVGMDGVDGENVIIALEILYG